MRVCQNLGGVYFAKAKNERKREGIGTQKIEANMKSQAASGVWVLTMDICND